MSGDIVVDFNVLPRATRERLIASTSPQATLSPILAEKETGSAFWKWLGCGLLGLGLLGVNVLADFGDFNRAFIRELGFPVVPYVLGIGMMTSAALGIVYYRKRKAALPFTPGRYLFPLDIVELRQRRVRVRSMNDVTSFKATHHHTNGAYTHTTFVFGLQGGTVEEFRVNGKEQAEKQLRVLTRMRDVFAVALEQQDTRTLQQMDLFFDVRMQGGFEAFQNKTPKELDGGPQALEVPARLGLRWGIALAAGVVLGGAGLMLRNLASDFSAFHAARQDGRAEAFFQYLGSGRLYVDEAKQLGADAQFTECGQTDTERCWNTYLMRWTGSPRFKEAQEERLPRAALKESSATVSALRGFRKRYPGSVVDEEAKALLHELFAKSLARFESQASTDDAQLIPFVSQLLAHLEATDSPRVFLRFRQESSPSLAKADKVLGKAMREEGKQMASVARHFEPQYTQPLERALASALSGAFKQIFPSDLLALELAPREQQQDSGSVPVMDFVYTIGWSGGAYRSAETGRVFVGIEFNFDADMKVPGQKPLSFRLRVTPPQNFTVQFTRTQLGLVGLDSGGPSDDNVYQVMALRAFDELSGKLRNVFFRPDSQAFQAVTLGGTP